MVWIKRDGACTESNKFLVTTREGSDKEGLWIECNGHYTLYVAPDELYDLTVSRTRESEWDEVVVVWDLSSLLVYYNEALQSSASPSTGSAVTLNTDNEVGFGPEYTKTTSVSSQGKIDGIRIYNKPLTPTDIAALPA